MGDIKTKVNDASVKDFLNATPDETKRKDSFTLLKMFEEITGEKAKMWGSSIVGFGKFHYKSERSTQEGDWPLVGFSPRKAALTLYVMSGAEIPESLGKFKKSVGCLYIKKLTDVDEAILRKIIKNCYSDSKKKYNA